jgi:hypothetical protein
VVMACMSQQMISGGMKKAANERFDFLLAQSNQTS